MSARTNVWVLRLTMVVATAVVIVTLVRGSFVIAVVITIAALAWAIWQSRRNRA